MQTPFNRLTSEAILSTHVNGLAHAINTMERTLGMKTGQMTGHVLNAVNDMDEIHLRNRIYEGSIRNWVTFTVRRDGVVVPAGEYVAHGGFGAVVFHVSQAPTATITVDATHIIAESSVIEELQEADSFISSYPVLQPSDVWINNFVGGHPLERVTRVLQAARTIDAFPMFISEESTFDMMRTIVSEGTQPATNMILGIYHNNKASPSTLIAQTTVFDGTTAGVCDVPLQSGSITLTPGLYWIARYQSAGVGLDGYQSNSFMQILDPIDSGLINGSFSAFHCQGVRTEDMGVLSTLPTQFPPLVSGGGAGTSKYFKRNHIGAVWIRKVR